jgi:hypothetical protein
MATHEIRCENYLKVRPQSTSVTNKIGREGVGVEKALHSGNFLFCFWWENYLKVRLQSTSVTNNIGREGGVVEKALHSGNFLFCFSYILSSIVPLLSRLSTYLIKQKSSLLL